MRGSRFVENLERIKKLLEFAERVVDCSVKNKQGHARRVEVVLAEMFRLAVLEGARGIPA